MESKLKPVPAFYGVYLLRSCAPRHSSFYVGSTPNPPLRLSQHNGKVQGGAVRTSRLSLRPWEMIAVVEGFPSNIAALQFEWAWHNSHKTTEISPEDKFSQPLTTSKLNKKTGKMRKKQGRPRASMMERVANLHLLLTKSSYFSKWPLSLRCFNEVFHAAWLSWDERMSIHVRPEIKVILDEKQPEEDEEPSSGQKPAKQKKADLFGKGGPDGLDVTYAKFQPVLLKLQEMIENSGRDQQCDICGKGVDMRSDLYNLCLKDSCKSITHVTCLSKRFLQEEKSAEILPRQGTCPSCKTTMTWPDLMRILTLRTRADKQVTKLLKKKKGSTATVAAELLEDDSDTLSEYQTEASDSDTDSDASSLSTTSTLKPPAKKQKRAASPLKKSTLPPEKAIKSKKAVGPLKKTEILDSEDDPL